MGRIPVRSQLDLHLLLHFMVLTAAAAAHYYFSLCRLYKTLETTASY
jgi:hypothetical protein